jgi:transcriptional regulator with XRE-family HTH domain
MDKIFQTRIKLLRIDRGWTQRDLAKKIGYTRSAVSAWEVGRNEPSHTDLVKLSEVFKVAVGYLVGSLDRPNDKEPEGGESTEDKLKHLLNNSTVRLLHFLEESHLSADEAEQILRTVVKVAHSKLDQK